MDLSFAVHKLAKFSSNPERVHFDVLVHLLSSIRDNQNLVLKYYAGMKDAPLSDMQIKSSVNTKNQFMAFLILVGNIFQTLAELQDYTLYFIKVGQLTMAKNLQDQLLNQVQKVITMQHALQEWL